MDSILSKIINKEAAKLLYYLFAIGIPFLIVYSIRKRKTGKYSFEIGIKNKRIIPSLILGLIALLLGIIGPIGSLIPMPEIIKEIFRGSRSQTGVSAFILMVIAAPILEELIFRGIILDGLLSKYTPFKSILISSLLFGLVHLNPWQFVTGFMIGIFMGWVYYNTRSVLPTIIIHAAANLVGFSVRIFADAESSLNNTLADNYGGITNFVLAIIGYVIVVLVCVYYLKKEFIKNGTAEVQI